MVRGASGAVQNLVSATRARRCYQVVFTGFSHGGKQNQFADFHADFVVVLFLTKPARQPATARREQLYRKIFGQTQYARRTFD